MEIVLKSDTGEGWKAGFREPARFAIEPESLVGQRVPHGYAAPAGAGSATS